MGRRPRKAGGVADVQPFDGQQRAVGRSRLFKVGDTDAAHGNAEGKTVDRKDFDGDGALTGLRELAFHDAAQHRRRQGNGKGGPQGAEEADSEKTGTPALAERRPRVRAFSSSACAETGGSGGAFLTARRFLRRLRCLEAMRVSCVG